MRTRKGSAVYSVSRRLDHFSKNQLGSVGDIPVAQRNECVHEVIHKNIFPKDFKVPLKATGMPTPP